MKRCTHVKKWAVGLLGFGFLFSGPCGITTLQLQDFGRSTFLRVVVQAAGAMIESFLVEDSARISDEDA